MRPKSILLVSNYYPPERGAAPNRIHIMAQALQKAGYRVQVVCPLPNYPTGTVYAAFKRKVYSKTMENDIEVHRLWLWPSKSTNKLVRLLSMLSFSFSLKWFFLLKRIPSQVIVQYSPVFVGFTAVWWCWLLRKKTILNVSDLWPLAGLEMGILQKGWYYTLLEKMERFCYRKSHLILGQSEEILSHIVKQGFQSRRFLYRNLPAFAPPSVNETPKKLPIKIVYAGLLGMAQGLSKILAAIELPPHVEIHIYGDGPDAETLAQPKNVQVIYNGAVSRETLHQEITKYDLAFIPLINRIYGSVPSKIFEFMRLGLPVLYMAGGEGGALVSENKLGWVVPVQDFDALQQFLKQLTLEQVEAFPKQEIQQRAIAAFDFERQFSLFLKELETL